MSTSGSELPQARIARGATPANCQGCNPRELSRAATRRELTAEALRRELRAQALGRFALPPPRTCAILSHRRGVQPPPLGAN